MVKGNEEILKVKWLLVEKQMVKFEEKEDALSISDDVMKFVDRIKAGDTVKVGIKDDTVIFIQKEKVEETSGPEQVVVWTVKAKTSNGEAMKFDEQPDEKTWYPVKDDLTCQVKLLQKGNKVEITLGKIMVTSKAGKEYPKEGVVSLNLVEEKKEEVVEKKEEKVQPTEVKQIPSYQKTTNDSIERQVALKGAIEIVTSLIEKDKITCSSIHDSIKELTRVCFEAMKEI